MRPKSTAPEDSDPCPICNKTVTRSHLPQHMRLHQRPHKCPKCTLTYANAQKLRTHQNNAHGGARIECTSCHKRFATNASLLIHERREACRAQLAAYVCAHCGRTFNKHRLCAQHTSLEHTGVCYACNARLPDDRHQAEEHIRRLHSTNMFWCDICGDRQRRAFYNRGEIRLHMREKHGPPIRYTCTLCPVALPAAALAQHVRQHHDQAAYEWHECRWCPERFAHREALTFHCRDVHVDEIAAENQTSRALMKHHHRRREWSVVELQAMLPRRKYAKRGATPPPDEPCTCPICGSPWLSLLALRQHLMTHGPREHRCEQCPAAFTTAQTLEQHRRAHSGVKPFACAECGKCFALQKMVKRHMRRHTGERPFACELCDRKLGTLITLRNHMRTHDVNRAAFECDRCGRAYKTEHIFRRHVESHGAARKVKPYRPGKKRWPTAEKVLVDLTVLKETSTSEVMQKLRMDEALAAEAKRRAEVETENVSAVVRKEEVEMDIMSDDLSVSDIIAYSPGGDDSASELYEDETRLIKSETTLLDQQQTVQLEMSYDDSMCMDEQHLNGIPESRQQSPDHKYLNLVQHELKIEPEMEEELIPAFEIHKDAFELIKRPRGRPRKIPLVRQVETKNEMIFIEASELVKKPRGRPRKMATVQETLEEEDPLKADRLQTIVAIVKEEDTSTTKRSRGRPRKNAIVELVEVEDHSFKAAEQQNVTLMLDKTLRGQAPKTAMVETPTRPRGRPQKNAIVEPANEKDYKFKAAKRQNDAETKLEGRPPKTAMSKTTKDTSIKVAVETAQDPSLPNKKPRGRPRLTSAERSQRELANVTASCPICRKSMCSLHQVRKHMLIHQRPYKCPDCTYSYSTPLKLRTHRSKAHATVFACASCHKRFDWYSSLRHHERNEACRAQISHVCAHCGRTFSKRTKCDEHTSLEHTGVCYACNARLPDDRHQAEKHIRRLHSTNMFWCDICGDRRDRAFLNRGAIRLHMRVEHGPPIAHACQLCPLVALPAAELAEHVRQLHDEASYEWRLCRWCPETFAHRDALALHSQTHVNAGPATVRRKITPDAQPASVAELFAMLPAPQRARTQRGATPPPDEPINCPVCDALFPSMNSVKQHLITVHGPRNHQCHECVAAFTTPQSLKDHLRRHTGEKPFACTLCGKGFATRQAQRRHMKMHAGEKRFACEVCGRKCSTSQALRHHMRTHDINRPTFECPVCSRRFRLESVFRRHLDAHGPDDEVKPWRPKRVRHSRAKPKTLVDLRRLKLERTDADEIM